MKKSLSIRHAHKRDYQLTGAKLHITITSTWPLGEAINTAMDEFAEELGQYAEDCSPALQRRLEEGRP
jgi:hypothetical protein